MDIQAAKPILAPFLTLNITMILELRKDEESQNMWSMECSLCKVGHTSTCMLFI